MAEDLKIVLESKLQEAKTAKESLEKQGAFKSDPKKLQELNIAREKLTSLLKVFDPKSASSLNSIRSSFNKIFDTIIKVGTPRKTFDMPNDKRILQPHLRRDLQKELGIAAVIEVADRVDTDFKITEEEMYEVYRDMRERGVVCGDFKYGNIGKLLRDNPPRNNERHGLHGNVTKTLKAGEYVVIDTDFFYKENDPKTELSSDLSIQFEKRYRREKGLDIEAKKETEVKKEMQVSPVKKGR